MDLGLFNSLSEDTYDLVTGTKGGTSSEINPINIERRTEAYQKPFVSLLWAWLLSFLLVLL